MERFSECGDDTPVTGGGVSILLEEELDDDLGGFISRVFRASCWSFINDGDKYALLAAKVLLASGSGIPGYFDCEKSEVISCNFDGVM